MRDDEFQNPNTPRCPYNFVLSFLLTYIMQADIDKDGTLDFGEFVAATVHLKKTANDEHLHKAFEYFDKDRNGYIEVEELRQALNDEGETTNDEVTTAIMRDVDTDKVRTFLIISTFCMLIILIFLHL